MRRFQADQRCNFSENSFTPTTRNILSLSGATLTRIDSAGNATSEIPLAGGDVSATLITPAGSSTPTVHYQFHDWLGTKWLQTDASGNLEETCTSDPFNGGLSCLGNGDISKVHFTGKERDTESGLDYFGARYYGSSMGRFMSPDPSGMAFTSLLNPQSFNMYSYVQNNRRQKFIERYDYDDKFIWS